MCVCMHTCMCVCGIHTCRSEESAPQKEGRSGGAGSGRGWGGESVSMVTRNLNKTSYTAQITVALSVATPPPSDSLRQPTAGPPNLPAASESLPFSLFPLLNLSLYNS